MEVGERKSLLIKLISEERDYFLKFKRKRDTQNGRKRDKRELKSPLISIIVIHEC
jgi:hypothetical protein